MFCLMIISLLLLGSFAFLYMSGRSKDKTYTAYIYQSGILIHSIPLSQITAPYELEIKATDKGLNVIRLAASSVGIVRADCPDQICVKQGFIHSSLLPITCLPHRLVIELREDHLLPSGTTIDAITY